MRWAPPAPTSAPDYFPHPAPASATAPSPAPATAPASALTPVSASTSVVTFGHSKSISEGRNHLCTNLQIHPGPLLYPPILPLGGKLVYYTAPLLHLPTPPAARPPLLIYRDFSYGKILAGRPGVWLVKKLSFICIKKKLKRELMLKFK